MVFFFDLDDTLLDDRAAKAHYMPKLYSHFEDHIKMDQQAFFSAWRQAIPRYYQKYAKGELTFEEQRAMRVRDAFGDWSLPNSLVSEVIRYFDIFFKEGWRTFPDTIRALVCLKDYRKGVITNGSTRQQNDKLDVLNVRSFFECVIVSEDVGVAKPDVKIFEMACKRIQCAPAESYFVGDRWDLDVVGSHAAGMNPIWLNPDKKELPGNLDGLIVIERLEQICEILGVK